MNPGRRFVGPTVPFLAAVMLFVAYGSGLPVGPAFAVAVVGLGLGVGLRAVDATDVRATFPVPVVVALGILAVFAGVAPFELLLVGLGGAAFVAWLADDPRRPPSGAVRGASLWLVPLLGVTLAWASSFLLPSSSAALGVAGGLAAGALVLLAVLLARPDWIERDPAATI